jgi:hypothetical protein
LSEIKDKGTDWSSGFFAAELGKGFWQNMVRRFWLKVSLGSRQGDWSDQHGYEHGYRQGAIWIWRSY